MSCKPSKSIVALLAATMFFTGCTPSKPIYLNDTGSLTHFVDQATRIEYPDTETRSLDEVTQSFAPITVTDPDFENYLDLTLEQCVGYALQNGKLFRGYGTPSLQGTRVSPGQDTVANGPAAAGTIYNVAIRESEPGFIGTPGQIGQPGAISTNTQLDTNQGVEAALADFDAQLTSALTWSKSDQPRNTVFTNPNEPLVFQQDLVQWSNEVAKKTANGTQIFFRNISSYNANSNPVDDPTTPVNEGFQVLDSFYQTSFEAEVRQPLLRGRGAFIQRMPIVISRIGTDQELANLDAQLQNYVTNVEIRYWDLFCAYRSLKAAKTGLNAALETYRIVKDQFDEGSDVDKQQVAQSIEQYHFFDQQVTESFNTLLNAEGALRYLLGWSSNDGQIIRPIDEPVMAPVEFDYCSTLCEALTNRPELRQQRWEIKKKELAVAYSKNGLLPELNATALYRYLGFGNKFGTSGDGAGFPDPSSGALNDLYDGNFQEFQAGLDFRLPIGFRRELANLKNAQLKLARDIARHEDMELDINRELHETFRSLATNLSVMRSSFNRWRSAQIEEDHFEDLKDAGVETLDVALDAQRRKSQAEISFYTAVCEYNKTLALMHRRKGTTLPYCGIKFNEGPWAGKAYLDADEYARRRGASTEMDYGWSRPNVISRGQNDPTAQNIGYTGVSTPTDIGYPIDNGIAPQMMYDQGQPMLAPGETIIDSGIPTEGYYQDGIQYIEQAPMMDNAPAPTLAPPMQYNGSSSRNATPRRSNKVRPVSYDEPVAQPKRRVLSATTQRQAPAPAKRTVTNPVRKPAVDNGPRPAKQLRTLKATQPRSKRESATSQTRTSVQPRGMDWEKFGMQRPSSNEGRTQATIRQN